MSPDRAEVPESCPSCNKEWVRKDKLSEIKVRSSAHLNVIENIARLRLKDVGYLPGFYILLEFDEPCVTAKPKP